MKSLLTVLVVCHGNINRSPLCTAVLRDLGGVIVTTAGFVNPGRRASAKMRDRAVELGYDLVAHRSQLVSPALLRECNLVVYMDGGNLKRLNAAMEEVGVRRPAICLATMIGESKIHDPAFQARGSEEFLATSEKIVRASRLLHQALLSL